MDVPPEPAPFSDNETALKQLHTCNIQDNLDLTHRTAPTRPTHNNNIPEVTECLQSVNMDRHFLHLLLLCTDYSKDLQLKTRRDVPHQKVINKIVDQLNSKTIHFYNLPFALDALRKSQCKDAFFSDIIKYLEDNHLPTNVKCQNSVIAEAEHYLLFHTLLFHFTVKSSKTVEHKIALCIPLELSDGIFELYHSSLMTSHQGLTRTYYKIRQDFFTRNLYKYLHSYIMSCRVCSVMRDIPFNQKQNYWSSQVIHDFEIMESISMDLKVMPTSFHSYNYLLVMRCNHLRFIITDMIKTRKASEVAESLFQKLICAHGTNIKEIYCDLDTAFKNEIVSTLFKTLGMTIKFCSVQSYQHNPAKHAIQSISYIIIHYITKYGNL